MGGEIGQVSSKGVLKCRICSCFLWREKGTKEAYGLYARENDTNCEGPLEYCNLENLYVKC